jgi:hypothetical protein
MILISGFRPCGRLCRSDTYVLGAFNPGLARLPNGNLLIMIRVAEALNQPIIGETIHAIRWDAGKGYVLDTYPLNSVNAADPRKFQLLGPPYKVMALTSLSWLLPVELTRGRNPGCGGSLRQNYCSATILSGVRG